MARACPGQSQELRTSFRSPIWVTRDQTVEPFFLCSQVVEQGAGSGVGQQGPGLVPTMPSLKLAGKVGKSFF